MRRNVRTLVGARTVALLVTAATIGGAAASAAAPRVVAIRRSTGSAQVSDRAALSASVEGARSATDAQARRQQLGNEALRRLRFDWRAALPDWRIEFKEARAEYLAMTLRTERRIEVYVRFDRSIDGLAHDLAHELGHAMDLTHNDEQRRLEYLRLRGLELVTPWWACTGCTDFEVAAGDFAETFAAWAAPRYRFYSLIAPEPTELELDAIATAMGWPAQG